MESPNEQDLPIIYDPKPMIFSKLAILIIAGVLLILAGFAGGRFLNQLNCFTAQGSDPSISPSPTIQSTATPSPESFAVLSKVLEGWKTLVDDQIVYYFPPQEYSTPSLLSEYSFISINNQQDVNASNTTPFNLSAFYYPERRKIRNNHFDGEIVTDPKGSLWLSANLTKYSQSSKQENLQVTILAHASSEMDLERLTDQIDGDNILIADKLPDSDFSVPENHITYPPNSIDKTGNYRFYLPSGYQSHENEGNNNAEWVNQHQENLCVAFEGINDESCRFSTSGCTCCNTGCELLDWVLLNNSNTVAIEPILQKGYNASDGPRFVYEIDHLFINHSASFYAEDNRYLDGVLDLIHLVESIEKVE